MQFPVYSAYSAVQIVVFFELQSAGTTHLREDLLCNGGRQFPPHDFDLPITGGF
jgi:hypothetical protein